MTLTSIRRARAQNGFTVSELLIVIVVIAILASITLVSYASIQNQTKAESVKANAESVKQVAQAYFNANNAYPTERAHFNTTFVTMPPEIVLLNSGSLTSSNGEDSIMYRYVINFSATGACVMYWDFAPESGSPGVVTLGLLGNATSATCNATTGILPS